MVNKLLQFLSIRCSHKKLSQPFAASSQSARKPSTGWDAPSPPARHYVVCLDCGHKMDYDWATMKVVGE
jgi:hypothetical protein